MIMYNLLHIRFKTLKTEPMCSAKNKTTYKQSLIVVFVGSLGVVFWFTSSLEKLAVPNYYV